jgi:hypothetical protein
MMSKPEIATVWWGGLVAAFGLTALTSLAYVLFPDAMLERVLIGTFLGSPDALAAHGEEAMRFIGFLSGISSGVSLAWMAVLTFVVLGPFRRGERWAWMAVATSVVIWFVVDSGRSIGTGFPSNAMFNVVWLVMYGVPLVATYRKFTAGQ